MRLDKLVGERFKERPADCVIDSHALMSRGGYMKYVAGGIYSSYAVLRRITKKIERIIREEMDAIGGQEVLFPVAMPASLLQESGRYESIGNELLRFTDRNGNPMVLGMTHEEAAVQLAREYGRSYAKYPFMIYQIQTKFRDEQRPRGGLIRVREFMMKDAYSFHVSQDDLENFYKRCFRAYENIFARVGIPEVISVASDSGMMGGSISHEFMLLTQVGEDSIVMCGNCGYSANMEAAECIVKNVSSGLAAAPLAKVYTPGMKTIQEVCDYLHTDVARSCKAVVYQKASTGEYIVVFIRGDLDVNETKLKNFTGGEHIPAIIPDGGELAGGFIGPYNLNAAPAAIDATIAPAPAAPAATIAPAPAATAATAAIIPLSAPAPAAVTALFDNSLIGTQNLCCGANEIDYHYIGLQIERDIGCVEYHDFAKAAAGGIGVCPGCGNTSLNVSRGIEVGNIFQLGRKYTESMNMRFMDENGDERYPLMGCYGIGIERLAASVCEARHDDNGPIWPMSIAPWQAHICCLRADDEKVRKASDDLYAALLGDNVEVIYDDRIVSAGVMFADADLLGIPIRLIVSPKTIREGCCELTKRDKSVSMKIPLCEVPKTVREMLI